MLSGLPLLLLLLLYLILLDVSLCSIWPQTLVMPAFERFFHFGITLVLALVIWRGMLRYRLFSADGFWFLLGNGILLLLVMSEELLHILLP